MSIRFRFSIWMSLFLLICGSLVGSLTHHTWDDLERAACFQARVRVADRLDEAASWHGIERGSGRSVLDGGEELLAVHMNARGQADQAVAEAHEFLSSLDRTLREELLTDRHAIWLEHLEELSLARRRFDAREISVDEWLQVTTDMISVGEMPLRAAVFRPVYDSDMAEYLNAELLPQLSQMAELAGLERQLIAGALATVRNLSSGDLKELATLRTRFEDSADHVTSAREIPGLPESLRRSIDDHSALFYGEYLVRLEEVVEVSQRALKDRLEVKGSVREAQVCMVAMVKAFEEDLRALCVAKALVARAKSSGAAEPDVLAAVQKTLESYMVVNHRLYSRVRLLGSEGRELARVNFDGRDIRSTVSEDVPDRSNHSRSSGSLGLRPREMHYSALELKQVNGKVVQPFEPILQISSPVYSDGQVVGAVIVDFNAQRLLDLVPQNVRAIDQDGYFLSHEDPDKTWGMMVELGREEQRLGINESGEGMDPMFSGTFSSDRASRSNLEIDSLNLTGPNSSVRIGLTSALPPVVYPMGPDVWMQHSTHAIGSLLAIRRELSTFATATSETVMEQAWGAMRWSLALLVAAIVVVFVLYRVVSRRVLAPMSQVVDVMEQLGRGEDGVRIGLKQADEVGRMSVAIDQFAENYDRARQDLGVQMAELIEARTRAEEANRLKGEFLSTITHEIRTPMNGILGTSQLLLETNLESEQMELLEIIDRSSRSLSTIINDILDFSGREADGVELSYRSFDLRTCIEGATEPFKAQWAEGPVELVVDVDPGADRVVHGDAKWVKQVLSQLLGNALKFTSEGHVLISVQRLGLGLEPGPLAIEVSDSGIGIELDAIPHLFEAFTQADGSVTRKFGGTGLGLAIAKQLVERMGGQLSVVSTIGEGSTFRCVLPLEAVEPPEHAMDPTLLEGQRMLVVDDLPEACEALARTLRFMGATVTLAAGQDDSQRELFGPFEDGFDAVFVDAEVPTANSGRLLQALASSQPAASTRVLGLLRGGVCPPAGDYLQLLKPVDLHSLRFALRRLAGPLMSCEPAAILPGESPPEEQEEDCAPVPEKDPAQTLVLLVEDNAINRRVAGMLLIRSGCEFVCAENGLEAIDLAGSQRFDLILMDLQMPVMGGIDSAKGIRDLPSPYCDVPIVALTANDTLKDRMECKEAGMDGFLAKPLTPVVLEMGLAAHLPGRNQDAKRAG